MRVASLAILLTLTLTSLGVQAQSQIYKTTDSEGNVIFTDTPPAEGVKSEAVELQQTNTTPAATVSSPAPQAEQQQADPAASPEVTITAPADETTIPMGPGDFTVFVNVDPRLHSGQQLQLLIDGEPWGDPQTSGAWQLTNIFRGAHDLTVELLESSGELITTSAAVRVYVMRPSVLNSVQARH